MDAAELINGLRQFLRMESLEPDGDGICAIVFDDGLEIELLSLTDKLLLIRSAVAFVPDDRDAHEEFYKSHLQHNLVALRQQAAALSLDEDAERIWLHRTVRTDRTDVREFCDVIEDFVNTVEWWRQFEQPAAGPAMPYGMPHHMLRP